MEAFVHQQAQSLLNAVEEALSKNQLFEAIEYLKAARILVQAIEDKAKPVVLQFKEKE